MNYEEWQLLLKQANYLDEKVLENYFHLFAIGDYHTIGFLISKGINGINELTHDSNPGLIEEYKEGLGEGVEILDKLNAVTEFSFHNEIFPGLKVDVRECISLSSGGYRVNRDAMEICEIHLLKHLFSLGIEDRLMFIESMFQRINRYTQEVNFDKFFTAYLYLEVLLANQHNLNLNGHSFSERLEALLFFRQGFADFFSKSFQLVGSAFLSKDVITKYSLRNLEDKGEFDQFISKLESLELQELAQILDPT